jgi:hypothetical protein
VEQSVGLGLNEVKSAAEIPHRAASDAHPSPDITVIVLQPLPILCEGMKKKWDGAWIPPSRYMNCGPAFVASPAL